MAIRATLGVSQNMLLSGQRADFSLFVENPSNGTATTITLLRPYASPASASAVLGRPLLSVPEAPYFLGAGSSVTFQFSGEFFVNQIPQAQSNAPTSSYPITVGVQVYASDGTITLPAVCNVFAFPAIGVNAGTATAVPGIGTLNFAANFDSAFSSVIAGCDPSTSL